MKKIILISIILLTAFSARTQDISGQWNGILNIQGTQLRIVFHIEKTDNGYTSTMDSPDQGATGIPVSSTSFEENKLALLMPNLGATYNGELKDGVLKGIFKQAGMNLPMDMTREEPEKEKLDRPQEPKGPLPYLEEEVTFRNTGADITLAGTLTKPKGDGKFPAVVMISGSGPQDRNEEVMGHKPFLIISDYLTRQGIAVLRYDDRGVGKSTGNFGLSTSKNFATDVHSALEYLRSRDDIDLSNLGLIGHSEGGLIAPMVAAKEPKLKFIVLLAGTGERGVDILKKQQELILKANGMSDEDLTEVLKDNAIMFNLILEKDDVGKVRQEVKEFIMGRLKDNPSFNSSGLTDEQFADSQAKQLANPWMLEFLKYDPYPTLKKVKCSVLAVNGEKDLQVPVENLEFIAKGLKEGKNKDVTTKAFPNLNHLFQEANSGSPNEYAAISQTFSPEVLEFMSSWILQRVK